MKNRIKCIVNGFKTFFETGVYIPHVYTENVTEAIIGATETSFRVLDSYEHQKGERIYPKAALIKSTCKICGHVEYSWFPSYKRWLEMNQEE